VPKITGLLAIKRQAMFLYSPAIMKEVKIHPASEKEMETVMRLAKSFDLDLEDVYWKQFVVAKKEKENEIIGFGRLRKYDACVEVATVGVIQPERNKGVGTSIVKDLMERGPKEIYVTCVIPNFFSRLGFEAVKQYPAVLQKKVDFCKLYDFTDEQIFVMRFTK
jgi:N-acetylglutamate synthase-like GNAT family acetyltransferase